jgi:hypothetical protein
MAGVEHIVTVTADGFDWQGRPTGRSPRDRPRHHRTRWNGWVFSG